jgi:hypothetical protein
LSVSERSDAGLRSVVCERANYCFAVTIHVTTAETSITTPSIAYAAVVKSSPRGSVCTPEARISANIEPSVPAVSALEAAASERSVSG